VGSKPEIIIALSTLEEPGGLIICNGYKDQEFIDLGLSAIKLGFICVFVVETPAEIPVIIERSRAIWERSFRSGASSAPPLPGRSSNRRAKRFATGG
jgi:arginine decarboxylase-like protein